MTAKFQMDGAGNFRVGIGDHFSFSSSYEGIAVVEHEGHKYMAISVYHSGLITPERVYELVEVPTEGEAFPNLNFFGGVKKEAKDVPDLSNTHVDGDRPACEDNEGPHIG